MAAERSSGNIEKCAGLYGGITALHSLFNFFMLKNIIAPVQAWLLSQGRCVGCGRDLPGAGGSHEKPEICSCGRMYIYDPAVQKYRRGTLDEAKKHHT